MIIQSSSSLKDLCVRIEENGYFGVDTEFIPESSYYPRLGIIQVATGNYCAVIDPKCTKDLEPFCALLSNASILTAVHAGAQDLQILARLSGTVPANIFDCQVAAALLGYGMSISYAKLVDSLLGIRLNKQETLTDWTVERLTPAQIEYALEDVRHLPTLAERLKEKLLRLDRMDWFREEVKGLEEETTYQEIDSREYFWKVKGLSGLSRRRLAVLRELAAWRENTSRTRDVPRGQMVRDPILIALAIRCPEKIQELRNIRLIHSSTARKYGDDILKAIRRGITTPQKDWPEPPARVENRLDETGVTDILQAVLRSKAKDLRIAPQLLATRADLITLVRHRTGETDVPCRLLSGWRKTAVAKDLDQVLSGQVSVSIKESGRGVDIIPIK